MGQRQLNISERRSFGKGHRSRHLTLRSILVGSHRVRGLWGRLLLDVPERTLPGRRDRPWLLEVLWRWWLAGTLSDKIRALFGHIVDRLGRETAVVLARVDFDTWSKGKANVQVRGSELFGK